MNFQIKKLVIWPKNSSFAPREVEFKIGKVNVITGASRTGKSAIIPIIDYCLASSDCFIPIDTIRDYAKWYGIIIKTDNEKILIARSVPKGHKVSKDYFLIRGNNLAVPPVIEESNIREMDVKLILNKIITAPFFSIGGENDRDYGARLSIRDLMALVFQSQEIVANQNILFYKTHAHEHRERLRNWFPYILGAETLDVLKARHELKDIEARLKRLKREFAGINKISIGWLANMRGLLSVADEYGLLTEKVTENMLSEELLYIAKSVIDNSPDNPKTNYEDIERANNESIKLEKRDEKLSESIGIAKKRLSEIKRLNINFIDYGKGIKKRTERLQLSKWLRDVATDSQRCPVCGDTEHKYSNIELDKICFAFERHEELSKKTIEIPTAFDREEILLKKELNDLIEERKSIQGRLDVVLNKDKKAKKDFDKRKQMFLFLGQLETTLKVVNSISDSGEIKKQIEELEKEQERLKEITNTQAISHLLERKTLDIDQKILTHLKTLDVESKYRSISPRFSVKDLSIQVQSDDGNWHFLAEVGSASNWVSFHLALFCALQEFFIEQELSIVPSFVVFDQPSQVYFPKLKRDSGLKDDPKYDNEDVDAVKSMFKTLSSSIKKNNGQWQAIVLDHADSSIYGNIDGVYEVDEWRNGKKLIPEEWYIESNEVNSKHLQ